jgi:hypothetical protein
LKLTILTVTLITAAMAFAFRLDVAGGPWFWAALGVPYLALAGLALRRLWEAGALLDVLQPRWGDFSLGFVTAAILLFASFGARAVLAPAGSTRLAWLFRVYAQIGDADAVQRSVLYTGALLLIVVCEELVWRSMVLDELTQRFGSRPNRGLQPAARDGGVRLWPRLELSSVDQGPAHPSRDRARRLYVFFADAIPLAFRLANARSQEGGKAGRREGFWVRGLHASYSPDRPSAISRAEPRRPTKFCLVLQTKLALPAFPPSCGFPLELSR